MQIPEPRQFGTLIKRYKRFLADVRLEDGNLLTIHCPNSGSMKGCSTPGSRVVISRSDNPGRKYPWTLEMVEENSTLIGVNTSRTNTIVREAFENGIIDDFGPLDSIEREVRVSAESRLDFLLQAGNRKIYVEVKNCSLAEDNIALFPDAVTKRGARHLAELEHLLEQGFEAAMIFCIQRADAGCFMPAAAIDPVYAETLYRVHERGVLVLAFQADVQPGAITLARKLPILEHSRIRKNMKNTHGVQTTPCHK